MNGEAKNHDLIKKNLEKMTKHMKFGVEKRELQSSELKMDVKLGRLLIFKLFVAKNFSAKY